MGRKAPFDAFYNRGVPRIPDRSGAKTGRRASFAAREKEDPN